MKARLHDAHVVYSARRWRESPNTALCAMGSVRRCKSVRAVRMCKVAKRRGEEDNAPSQTPFTIETAASAAGFCVDVIRARRRSRVARGLRDGPAVGSVVTGR
jgi:hypothetical protein